MNFLPLWAAAADEMMALVGCGVLLMLPLLVGVLVMTATTGRSQHDRMAKRLRRLEQRVQTLDQRLRELQPPPTPQPLETSEKSRPLENPRTHAIRPDNGSPHAGQSMPAESESRKVS